MTRTVEIQCEYSITIDETLSIAMHRQEYICGEHEGERHYIGTPETRGASPGDVDAVARFLPGMQDVAIKIWETKGIKLNMPRESPYPIHMKGADHTVSE